MKKSIGFIFILSMIIPGQTQNRSFNGMEISANRVVLKISAEYAPALGQDPPLSIDFSPQFKSIIQNFTDYQFYPLFIGYRNFNESHYRHQLHQYYVLESSGKMDYPAVRRALLGVKGVEDVEPDYRVTGFITPNDTFYPDQWAHNNTGQAGPGKVGIPDCDTDSDEAWDITTGHEDIIIAILDTGVNPTHSELSGKMV